LGITWVPKLSNMTDLKLGCYGSLVHSPML